MPPYERFKAWQLAHELVLKTHRATSSFPADERYGLTSQSRRAAFSAAANIAEGSAKRGPGEFRRFLDITLGSLSELSYCFRLATDLGLLSESEWWELNALREETSKATWGLYRAVRDSAHNRPPGRLTA